MRLCSISEFDGGARKVDEQLFSGAVHHAQRAFEAFNVVAVIDAELRVLVHTLAGVTLHKLLPQQHDGHAFAAHLMMQMAKVWPNKVLGRGCWRDEPSLQFSLTQLGNVVPAKAQLRGQANVFGDNAFGDSQGCSNLALG
jgi:hypothetical protein